MTTAAVGFPDDIAEGVLNNRTRWCREMGVSVRWVTDPLLYPLYGRHPNFVKIPCILDALSSDDEVLWIDADALIVNMPRMSDLRGSMAVAKDDNGWNIGVWYVRRKARWVLECMWEQTQYNDRPFREQGVFMDLDRWGFLHELVELGEEWNAQRDYAPLKYIRHWAGQYDTRFDSMRKYFREGSL